MPNDLITDYLAARNVRDHAEMLRIEELAADYDRHNPFGPRLLDEIRGLRLPAAA